jgi:hypothetical protein
MIPYPKENLDDSDFLVEIDDDTDLLADKNAATNN